MGQIRVYRRPTIATRSRRSSHFWGRWSVPYASEDQSWKYRTRPRRSEWSNSSSNLSGRIRPPRALKRRPAHLSIVAVTGSYATRSCVLMARLGGPTSANRARASRASSAASSRKSTSRSPAGLCRVCPVELASGPDGQTSLPDERQADAAPAPTSRRRTDPERWNSGPVLWRVRSRD